MPINEIIEIQNPNPTNFRAIREKQDIFIPDIINLNISRRNGMIYALQGSGGSGKTNLLLNLFRSKNCYRNKFHNIYYFCPSASFSSLDNHPFQKHDKVYHELTPELLETVFQALVAKKNGDDKEKVVNNKKKQKRSGFESDEEVSESNSDTDEEEEIQYSCVIIDDFADLLKDVHIQKQLNKMLIKARHLCCGFIFTLQSYLYFPKMLRKQLTYITIFKTKNVEEWYSIANELLNLKKDDALVLYNYVFDKPYTHLDVDTTTNRMYKNFNLLELRGTMLP